VGFVVALFHRHNNIIGDALALQVVQRLQPSSSMMSRQRHGMLRRDDNDHLLSKNFIRVGGGLGMMMRSSPFFSLSSPSSSSSSSNQRVRSSTPLSPSLPSSSSQLRASLVPVDPAIASAAASFFTGIRIPAQLVAGSSIATLFALSRNVKDTSMMSRTENFLYRIHHILSLLMLCLSSSCVLTSTTANTLLLLSKRTMIPSSAAVGAAAAGFSGQKVTMDAYYFLRTYMPFEFLYTRWSFLVSILLFFGSTTTRLLLEFDLFKGKRRIAGLGVVSLCCGIQSFMISYINTTQHSFLSLWDLTKEVFKIVWNNAASVRQPMMVASLTCFAFAALFGTIFLLPTSMDDDKLADSDRYT